jgi:zinc/manganese transport system substrate-binding protein
MKRKASGLFSALGLYGLTALVGAGLLVASLPSYTGAKKRLRVVTTIRPLYAFATRVAGRAAEVESLLPPGVGPHDYAFTPSDAVRLHTADVLIINGLGLETWLERLLRAAARSGLVVIDSSRGIEPLELPEAGHRGELGSADRHRDRGRWDPHVWLDPLRAVRQVENIRDGLSAHDPDHAGDYAENAGRYIERLRALHGEMERAASGFKRRELMTFHSAFQYFTRRYGLEVVAVVEPAPGKEPTPRFLAHLHEVARRHGLKVVYSEPQYRPRLAEVLARDLGLEVAVLDPGVTGPLEPDAYESVMRSNLKVLGRYQSR